jgi:hypothetical protein
MPVKVRGWLRFTKSTIRTTAGHKVAVCFGMRRIEREDAGYPYYHFRCKPCGWRWQSAERLPLEVRLHLQLHHPDRRWRPRWATQPPDGEHCPSCGFSQISWAIVPEGQEEE